MLPDRLLIGIHKWSRVLVVIGMATIALAMTIAAVLGFGLLTPQSVWRHNATELLVAGISCLATGGAGLYGSRWGRGV